LTGDAQHLAAPTVQSTGHSKWIDGVDADQAEGLLPIEQRGEECRNAARATVAGVITAPHRRTVGDDRPECRSDRRAVHTVGSVDTNGRGNSTGQGAAQALIGRRTTDGDCDESAANGFGVTKRHLDCSLVGRRHRRCFQTADPLDAHRNHQVVRKTTP
jgi:hypothetical protein